MVANRNWGQIASGETFEALVQTLAWFEDSSARLFGRRGPDSGQDLLSSDGTLVYQAKHHVNPSPAKAIADAKNELRKIQTYKRATDVRHDHWTQVTGWRLVTNAHFNRKGERRWADEVVPVFQAQGLHADYWDRSVLDALLAKHPEVDRCFFGNSTRAFLSVPEAERFHIESDRFLRKGSLGDFLGREAELERLDAFMKSDDRFLLVTGPGGVGKTRLLLEFASITATTGSWQVLWALVHSMETSGEWFNAIDPERPTLLIVDEPEGQNLLTKLAEQLTARLTRWKVVVAVRSSNDPVLKFFSRPDRQAPEPLTVGGLSTDTARSLCRTLLAHGDRPSGASVERLVEELAERFDYPIWLTLAASLVQDQGNLSKVPEHAEELADVYIAEFLVPTASVTTSQLRSILRWCALVGPLNVENNEFCELVFQRAGTDNTSSGHVLLRTLADRGALTRRGAFDRLIEAKPDVLRDRVLTCWLTENVGGGRRPWRLSPAAHALVDSIASDIRSGNTSVLTRRILQSLARTEFLMTAAGREVSLLEPVFDAIHAELSQTNAPQRLELGKLLASFAFYHPLRSAALATRLRTETVPPESVEGLFGSYVVTHSDVLRVLPQALYRAATGARRREERLRVLGELFELALLECEVASEQLSRLPNDGQSASSLLGTVLEGGPSFWTAFDDEACLLVLDRLSDVSSELSQPLQSALSTFLQPLLALHRRRAWDQGEVLRLEHYWITETHPAWAGRRAILDRVMEALWSADTPESNRIFFWSILAEAHCRGMRAGPISLPPEYREKRREEQRDNLRWAKSLLEKGSPSLGELKSARSLWKWHAKHEPDAAVRALAQDLEALYSQNDLALEFEPLFGQSQWEEHEANIERKAQDILSENTTEAISAFIKRALAYFRDDETKLWLLNGLSWCLGSAGPHVDSVRVFIRSALASSTEDATPIALRMASAWVHATRQSTAIHDAHELVAELLDSCATGAREVALLEEIYARAIPKPIEGRLPIKEWDLLRSRRDLFLANGRARTFVSAVAATLQHEWAALKTSIAVALAAMSTNERQTVGDLLIDRVYWAIHEAAPSRIPDDLLTWLADTLIQLPEFDETNQQWHLNEILKRVPRLTLTWLPSALAERSQLQVSSRPEASLYWTPAHAFCRFVDPITESNCSAPVVKAAASALVDLVLQGTLLPYSLIEAFREVDPAGLVVPDIVAARLQTVTEDDDYWRLARLCGTYSVGSEPWRRIARAILMQPHASTKLFSALEEIGPQFWSGDVPPHLEAALAQAQQMLKKPDEAVFLPYWEWRRDVAESEVRRYREEAKERDE